MSRGESPFGAGGGIPPGGMGGTPPTARGDSMGLD